MKVSFIKSGLNAHNNRFRDWLFSVTLWITPADWKHFAFFLLKPLLTAAKKTNQTNKNIPTYVPCNLDARMKKLVIADRVFFDYKGK